MDREDRHQGGPKRYERRSCGSLGRSLRGRCTRLQSGYSGARRASSGLARVRTQSLLSHALTRSSEVEEVYFHHITTVSASHHKSHRVPRRRLAIQQGKRDTRCNRRQQWITRRRYASTFTTPVRRIGDFSKRIFPGRCELCL